VVEDSLSYLGMQLVRDEQKTIVDMAMTYYVDTIIDEAGSVAKRGTPGTRSTFSVDESSEKLSEKERELFHSMTAKILYLAKRARPDVLMIVSYLCTRVTKATQEDKLKLQRLIGYLKQTNTRTLVLRPNNNLRLQVYINAAFALHEDVKSHTGVIVFANGVPVYVVSRKAKMHDEESYGSGVSWTD
jgi:hypothetical protein